MEQCSVTPGETIGVFRASTNKWVWATVVAPNALPVSIGDKVAVDYKSSSGAYTYAPGTEILKTDPMYPVFGFRDIRGVEISSFRHMIRCRLSGYAS